MLLSMTHVECRRLPGDWWFLTHPCNASKGDYYNQPWIGDAWRLMIDYWSFYFFFRCVSDPCWMMSNNCDYGRLLETLSTILSCVTCDDQHENQSCYYCGSYERLLTITPVTPYCLSLSSSLSFLLMRRFLALLCHSCSYEGFLLLLGLLWSQLVISMKNVLPFTLVSAVISMKNVLPFLLVSADLTHLAFGSVDC